MRILSRKALPSTYFVAYTRVLVIVEYPVNSLTSIVDIAASKEFAPQELDPTALLLIDWFAEGKDAPDTSPVVRMAPLSIPQGPFGKVPELFTVPEKLALIRSRGFPDA